jgi:hypothetical protein
MPTTIIVNPGDSIPDLTTLEGSLDVVRENLRLTATNFGHYTFLRVILADNAFLPGRLCPSLTFTSMRRESTVWDLLGNMLTKLTPENIRVYAKEIERRHPRHGTHTLVGGDGQKVHRADKPGMTVFFSPAATRVIPLAKVPSKWTLEHVIQVLANGHCSLAQKSVRCPREEYVGFDTKLVEIAPLHLLEELMEPKHSWDSRPGDMKFVWNSTQQTLTLKKESWSRHSVITLAL